MNVAGKIDLNALPIFAAVADCASFTLAAERLGVAKTKVSLEIGRLEERLGRRLFNRTTRRVALTDAGRALYADCVPLVQRIESALTRLGDDAAPLAGKLRISATVDQAAQSLAGAVAQFGERHPAVQIELLTNDRVVDLVKDGIDLAFRVGWLRDSSQRAIKLGAFRQYVVASPAYLARAGRPARPEDLAGHAWVALNLLPKPLTWTFADARGATRTVRMQARLRADSASTLRALVENDAGFTALDEFSAAEPLRAGRLVRVLANWSLPVGGVYAVSPPGSHRPAVVRAFVDFYRVVLERRAE